MGVIGDEGWDADVRSDQAWTPRPAAAAAEDVPAVTAVCGSGAPPGVGCCFAATCLAFDVRACAWCIAACLAAVWAARARLFDAISSNALAPWAIWTGVAQACATCEAFCAFSAAESTGVNTLATSV